MFFGEDFGAEASHFQPKRTHLVGGFFELVSWRGMLPQRFVCTLMSQTWDKLGP